MIKYIMNLLKLRKNNAQDRDQTDARAVWECAGILLSSFSALEPSNEVEEHLAMTMLSAVSDLKAIKLLLNDHLCSQALCLSRRALENYGVIRAINKKTLSWNDVKALMANNLSKSFSGIDPSKGISSIYMNIYGVSDADIASVKSVDIKSVFKKGDVDDAYANLYKVICMYSHTVNVHQIGSEIISGNGESAFMEKNINDVFACILLGLATEISIFMASERTQRDIVDVIRKTSYGRFLDNKNEFMVSLAAKYLMDTALNTDTTNIFSYDGKQIGFAPVA